MKVSIYIIVTLLTLLLVVGIHELGHALMARLFKVKITAISFGFGKPFLQWRSPSGINWMIGRYPLGGYVSLLNSRIQPTSTQDLPFCFDKKPILVRFFILIAGSLANMILAFSALSWMNYLGYQVNPPIVKEVTANSFVARNGLEPGDTFLRINYRQTQSWQEAGSELFLSLGKQQVNLLILQASGIIKSVNWDLSHINHIQPAKRFLDSLGLKPELSVVYQKNIPGKTLYYAILNGFKQSGRIIELFYKIVILLAQGNLPFSILLGPLGFMDIASDSFLQGLSVYLYFLASFSLSAGLVNLFPFPGLDGGSIFYLGIEVIRKKPLSIALEVLLYRLAAIAFFILFIQLILNDLKRYLGIE